MMNYMNHSIFALKLRKDSTEVRIVGERIKKIFHGFEIEIDL